MADSRTWIVRTDDAPWPVQAKHQEKDYAGAAWANEIAKRGYVDHRSFDTTSILKFVTRRFRRRRCRLRRRRRLGHQERGDVVGRDIRR